MKDRNKKFIFSFYTLSVFILNVFLCSTNVYAKDRLYGKNSFDTSISICRKSLEKKLGNVKRIHRENRCLNNLSVLQEFKEQIFFNKIYASKGSCSVENKENNSSEEETNQQENNNDKPLGEKKELKTFYEVELSQIKFNIENIKDSMLSIKVCDSRGNIEYLNQIDKEKIQEGKATLAFNVKKEDTYTVKILGNESQNAKIENIKVTELTKILEIKDINISINENEKFIFPKTVKAKMSNGKEKKVKIVWDHKEVDTSKKGKYTFEGTVEGYDKKVKLNLQVKELEKIKLLENITVQLEQNDPYNMPKTITAIMNTGDKKEVIVKWNSVLDTSKIGVFVIEGIVEGFEVKAKLIAKIIAIDENEVVKFKDPVFEQVIRDILYIEGDITRKDLNEIEELEVPSWMGYELNSIEDISLLRNLKTLDLFGNFIENIEPLKKLHNLEVLNLGACEAIENVEPLRNLAKLKELKLNGNIINNIEPLVNLTNLEKLNLGGNPIKNFSPTGKYFNKLKEKDFDLKLMETKDNTIEIDIEEGEKFFLPSVVTLVENKKNVAVKWDKNKANTDIAGKYTFEGYIEETQSNIKLNLNIRAIDNNKKVEFKDKELEKAIRMVISKPSGEIYRKDIVKLKKLPSLYSVKDLSGIENLQGLEELIIMTTPISDITPISKLKNLKRLELDTVGITRINSGVFDDLNKLEFLNLAGNGIENISLDAFRELKNLKELNLTNNRITNIKSGILFDNLNKLEELTLDSNKISISNMEGNVINTIKVDAFRGLKNLNKLNIQDMELEKIDFLEDLSNLEWIDMRNNNIKDIRPIGNSQKLNYLWADHNKIEDLTPIKSLTEIENLKLNNNEIKDIQPLKKLCEFKKFVY